MRNKIVSAQSILKDGVSRSYGSLKSIARFGTAAMVKSLFLLITLMIISATGYGQTMEEGFASPPDNTRPGVYWYWINEHISKEGITKDLESLAKLGIGEVYIGNIFIEGLPPGNVKTLSPQWQECMQFAIKEATRLGINIGLFNSPGWGTSGGPWIKPEDAMRYLTCNQVVVSGPAQVNQFIAKPKDFFQDVVLLAFPVTLKNTEKAHISSIPESRNLVGLMDESTLTGCIFNNRKGEQVQIDLEYNQPVTGRGLTIIPSGQHFVTQCEVYAEKGSGFTLIKTHSFDRLRLAKAMGPEPFAPLSLSLGEVVASRFRIVMKDVPANFRLSELSLSEEPVLEDYQEKLLNIMPSMATPDWHAFIWKNQEQESSEGVVDLTRVQNISRFLHGDTLKWKVPEGAWKIVRVGMTTTGTINDPAAPGAVGLEIDKMNRRSLGFHFDSYLGKVVNGMNEEDLKSFKKIVADSYEAGPQNWTDELLPVFKKTYGYDPLPWMTVLTGHIVGSADQSNRFLWDLRRLVADRVASEYAGGLRELCEKKGKELWLENYGWNGFPSEFLKYGSYANGIAGEFWTNAGQNIESRLAASAAHIYGKNTVYAESYTTLEAPYEYHPGNLKRVGDKSYTDGINQHILHVSIHQPDDTKFPGISTWFGIEFNRQNTWFSHSKSWVDYQRRCCYMLQQGKPSADVCFFIGEESPRMSGWVDENLSKGYDYDFINADAIENLLTVVNGRLTLPSGVSYSLLALPPLETMRPALLKRIKVLVEQGANVLGRPVDRSPSLANYPGCDKEVQSLALEIWGTTN
ncbi:MAG: hypothetical protein JXR41_05620, partial [Bacteroidales bacterium]|nr:hypothetical protein [Bacteroidales bacterium]